MSDAWVLAAAPAVPLREPVVAVPARVLAHWQQVLPELPVLAQQVPVQVLPQPVLVRVLVVLAQVVHEPAVPVQHLLSRQSFSAAMAGTTPSSMGDPTYEPVPRSS